MKNTILTILKNQTQGWIPLAILIIIFAFLTWLACRLIKGKNTWKWDGKISEEEKPFYKSIFTKYFLWGSVQQLLVVLVYYLLNIPFKGSIWVPILAAGVFGFMHTPNIVLIFATFAMGQVFLTHWQEYHNIVAIGFAHGFLATLLQYHLPNKLATTFSIWKNFIRDQKNMMED